MPKGPLGAPRPFAKVKSNEVKIREVREGELKITYLAEDESEAKDIADAWIEKNVEGSARVKINPNQNEMVFRVNRGDANTFPRFETTIEVE